MEKQIELHLFRLFHNEKNTENFELSQKKKQHEIEKVEKKKEKAEELLNEKKKRPRNWAEILLK